MRRLYLAVIRFLLSVGLFPRPTYERPTRRRAVRTAAFAFFGGSLAALPLYAAFPWYDLFTHFVGGAVVAAVAMLAFGNVRFVIGIVGSVALGWELFEKFVPTAAVPIYFVTGDSLSDMTLSVLGGLAAVAYNQR